MSGQSRESSHRQLRDGFASPPPRNRFVRLIFSWLAGAAVGTLLIAVTSPAFVRSYLPLHVDPLRGVWTLQPNQIYRWRSEGYANTHVGPLGMPGQSEIAPPDDPRLKIALWGDSQAEGVCVADAEKLHAEIERQIEAAAIVYPFARSGEDAAVWLTQMPAVERELGVDAHIVLIVDLPDLLTAPDAPLAPADPDPRTAIAAWLPAFVIHAARHLLTEADELTPRKLRFSLGPVTNPPLGQPPPSSEAAEWTFAVEAIAEAADSPLVIVYAPHAPQIIGGRIQRTDSAREEFEAMKVAAAARGITVIDMSSKFRTAVEAGVWPRGFHNGQIGSGHLNANGYRLIAKAVAEVISDPMIVKSFDGTAATASEVQRSIFNRED